MIELSIIIPAFNEARNLKSNVGKVKAKLQTLHTTYEIILVNDGSKDNTLAVMHELKDSHLHVLSYDTNQGKGFAVRLGMLNAKGKYRIFMDADLSTSLDAIDEALKMARQGKHDVLVAERLTFYKQQRIHQPFHRRFLGSGFRHLSRAVSDTKITDFTCGFKLFTDKATAIVFPKQQINQWAFDTEILAIAAYYRLKIGEFPVQWNHHDNSRVNAMRDVVTSLRDLIKIKFFLLTSRYKT